MSDTIRMSTNSGVRDAHRLEDREYREIEDTGLAVARGGRVYMEGEFPEIDDFPWMTVSVENSVRRAHVPAAVALAWLTPEERSAVRTTLDASAKASEPKVKELAAHHNVWAYAIAEVAASTEENLAVLQDRPLQYWGDKAINHLENVEISDYKTFLVEHSRPPSKGGNTSAMHAHTIWIGDRKYSFWARGARKFIFKGDQASFDYYETEDGYLNILPKTIVCRDAKGKIVRRGDRRSKAKLRSAPTRMPGSRRERRD